ncbi:MAG TPA: hypothetical protein VGS21_12595 [Acidimicrobiales bacterium]|nr:hypothetical protein [Acidimicrobiales bacterium]
MTMKEPLLARLRNAVLAPVEDEDRSARDLEHDFRSADDKERMIGLIAAPFAAAIAFLVVSALIDNDPPALLKNGQVDRLHVSVGLYQSLGLVLLGLSLIMLATALWRKRLLLGISSALYGLAIFNLHYFGFGVPFVLVGAWYLVRSYRMQKELRETAAYDAAGARAPAGGLRLATVAATPRANKRYTPPALRRQR